MLTSEVLEQAQDLLNEGQPRNDIAQKLDVKPDTLRKAINDGRLQELKKPAKITVKSSRIFIITAKRQLKFPKSENQKKGINSQIERKDPDSMLQMQCAVWRKVLHIQISAFLQDHH